MAQSPVLGGELLRLVTAGMYDNPLVLYREYVQNAADAIAARNSSRASVHITIDPLESSITVLDNGTGLAPDEAVHRLIDLGRSPKDPSVDRGFRGIGRLAGLAFADQLHFTTRSSADTPPTRVSWDARALRQLDLPQVDAKTAIQECTTTTQVSDGDWPDRFFQATIERVNRHAAATLLNQDAVRSYLSEVCPVPMAARFPFADEVRAFVSDHTDYFVLDIHLNEDQAPIKRPFLDTIPLSDRFAAPFEDLDTHVIPRPDTEHPAALVWLAHTPYTGSIPGRLGVRGLRARVGNMQIGTDRIFEHLFQEPRFNGWCVGEVHILDSRIVPNGRRDYFEPSPHLRNLENQLGAIAQAVSTKCRRASSQRNKLRNVEAAIHRLDKARDLAQSGYLPPADAASLLEREQRRIPEIQNTLAHLESIGNDALHDLTVCATPLEPCDLTPHAALSTIPTHSRPSVQSTFATIAQTLPPDSALELIETILHQLTELHADDPKAP